jgi:hypothetical protein
VTKPGPSVTSGADTQPGSDSLFPSGFGGGSLIRAGGVGTSEIADSSIAAADLNLPSVSAALAARSEFTGTYARVFGCTASTDAAIRDAVTRAQAAGGGVVQLPNASVALASPLPLVSGVVYVGTEPALTEVNTTNGTCSPTVNGTTPAARS